MKNIENNMTKINLLFVLLLSTTIGSMYIGKHSKRKLQESPKDSPKRKPQKKYMHIPTKCTRGIARVAKLKIKIFNIFLDFLEFPRILYDSLEFSKISYDFLRLLGFSRNF